MDNNEFNVVSSYFDWRKQQNVFQGITSMQPGTGMRPAGWGEPVSDRLLLCGVELPEDARTRACSPSEFTREDDQPTRSGIALAVPLWQNRFGGDPHAIGQNVIVDEQPVRVAGVLPKGFEMPQAGLPDLLMPERLDATRPRAANSSSFLRTFARLREGFSIDQRATGCCRCTNKPYNWMSPKNSARKFASWSARCATARFTR